MARSVRSLFDDPPPPRPGAEAPLLADVAWVSETGRPLAGAPGVEPLIEAVEAYVLAGPGADRDAGPVLDRAIEKARGEPPSSATVDAVEALLRYAARDEGALDRARALVTPGVASLLVRRLSEATDEAARDRLVHGLAELGDGIRPATLEALRTPNGGVGPDTGTDPALLGLLGILARDAPGMLEELVNDPDWRVVAAAITVAGDRGGDGAMQILTLALAHSHPRVRRRALSTIRKLGGGGAGELARGMLADRDPGVRAEAARAVGDLNVPQGAADLLQRLEAEHEPSALRACIRALGVLREAAAVPELARLARGSASGEGGFETRGAALRALHGIGGAAARAAIGAALDDPVPQVRELAERLFEASAPDGPDAI